MNLYYILSVCPELYEFLDSWSRARMSGLNSQFRSFMKSKALKEIWSMDGDQLENIYKSENPFLLIFFNSKTPFGTLRFHPERFYPDLKISKKFSRFLLSGIQSDSPEASLLKRIIIEPDPRVMKYWHQDLEKVEFSESELRELSDGREVYIYLALLFGKIGLFEAFILTRRCSAIKIDYWEQYLDMVPSEDKARFCDFFIGSCRKDKGVFYCQYSDPGRAYNFYEERVEYGCWDNHNYWEDAKKKYIFKH